MLITFYFLSARGRMPDVPKDAGPVTIVVNSCMLAATLSWTGLVTAGLWLGIALRLDHRWWTIAGKALFFGAFGWLLAITDDSVQRTIGYLTLFAVFCLLTPLSRWVESNIGVVVLGIPIAAIGAILLVPGWMQRWYMSEFKRNYMLIPLSDMRLTDWILVLMGAAVYVLAYVAFQQWVTEGRWLDIQKNKLSGKVSDGH
jgi:hypothetical protein